MRLVENAWMVLPGMAGVSWAVAPQIAAASAAMLGLGIAGAHWLRRDARRDGSGRAPETRSAS